MVDEIKRQASIFWTSISDPKFLWGVLASVITAAFFIVTQAAAWSRSDERMHNEIIRLGEALTMLKADYVKHVQDKEVFMERTNQNVVDIRGLLERTSRLEAKREEDDKRTQADALRDAEYRARVAAQLERMSDNLNRMAQTAGVSGMQRQSMPDLNDLLNRDRYQRRLNETWHYNNLSPSDPLPLELRIRFWSWLQNGGIPVRTAVGE